MTGIENNLSNGPSIFSDLQSLNGIRLQGQQDSRAAIKAAAKEFEAFFMNMMLKSMRQASDVIGDGGMFSSPQEKMFIGMLDEQMSVELSQKGNLGIADLMVQNLLGHGASIQTSQKDEAFRPSTVNARYDSSIKNITNGFSNKINDEKSVPNSEKHPHISQKTGRPISVNGKFSSSSELANKATESTSNLRPEKKSLFENAKGFVKDLLPLAKKVADKIGVDPRLLLAQAALETGWGKHIIHDSKGLPGNNLFGIKSGSSWRGESVKIDTVEIENGEVVKKKASFRIYESLEESFDD